MPRFRAGCAAEQGAFRRPADAQTRLAPSCSPWKVVCSTVTTDAMLSPPIVPLQDAVHLEVGLSTQFAFVFSCPGQCECEADPPRPAKGQTGENLDQLTRQLDPDRHQQLQGLHRGQARITNAWDQVMYAGHGNGRTEPRKTQVLQPGNLNRLRCELAGITCAIICFGDLAKEAVLFRLAAEGRLHAGVRVLVSPHLSPRRLNTMYPQKKVAGQLKRSAATAKPGHRTGA